MLLKAFTWLFILRPHSSIFLNSLYCTTAAFMFWSYVQTMHDRPIHKRPLNSHTMYLSKPPTRYCERCDADKGANVHHCSVCNRCVYRMDHHCPWTGNCVAWTTKKCFLLFLLYTSLSCWTFNLMVSRKAPENSLIIITWLLQCGWILTLSIGLLLAGYFVFHLWLLREGKTTLEFLSGKPGELADCSFKHNVTVYFGRDMSSWWIPMKPVLDAAMGGRERDETDEHGTLTQLVVTA
uniref:Palmitoyltransferase n=1 Tax=Hyaloperonospora arabidopsidis (strain Emoy2) TaxID=559515 RepID=M4BEQ5_HYAAE